MSTKKPNAPDDSVIDITGLFERLTVANAAPPPPPKPKPMPYIESAPGSGIMVYNYDYYYREPPTLGATYGEKLALTPRQVIWLDKFYLPGNNTFLNIELVLQATLMLYLAVLPELDRQLKIAGTTLAKEAKYLEDAARSIAYHDGFWYSAGNKSGKVGADIYLAIFRVCENALRQRFNYARKSTKLFVKRIERLEIDFQKNIGQRIGALLPTLLPHVPPVSPEVELIFNEQAPHRWKSCFEQLTALLPANAPTFVKAVQKLAKANARNPTRESIYFEAAKLLARPDREAALLMYLHYLHNGDNWVHREPKPLPKALEKILFPLPEHAQRFTMIMNLLELNNDRKSALEKVATVYVIERKKIELDHEAVQAARQQHAGTVELLNEYLRDEPAPAPVPAPTPKAPKAAGKAPALKTAKPTASSKVSAAEAAKASPAQAAPAGPAFAPALAISTPQQELLNLFTTHKLALTQAAVEALAQRHGALRNQLIDSLNEKCYELLDDVLIEETDTNSYAIYPPYFQQILA